jgi:hypothetical protein
VVDVDDPVRHPADEVVAEDLHVAGQHDQVDPRGVQQLDQPRLLRRLVPVHDRDVVERHAEEPAGVRVVGWLLATKAMSACSSPVRQRASRSSRQCGCWDARMATRCTTSVIRSSQAIEKRSLIGASAGRISSSPSAEPLRSTSMRWKKMPSCWSLCWSASRMLAPLR